MWNESFNPRWKKALSAAPRQATEYKSSKLAAFRGEFIGWTQVEAGAFTKSVVDVIADPIIVNEGEDADLLGIAITVVFPDIIVASQQADFQEAGVFWCVGLMLQTLSFIAIQLRRAPDNEISVIYDARPTRKWILAHQQKFSEFLSTMEGAPHLSFGGFQNSADVPALQAADLLAYETRKEAESRLSPLPRPVRHSLQRLVASRPHFARAVHFSHMINTPDEAWISWKGPPGPSALFRTTDSWRESSHWPYSHEPWRSRS